jgi:hypothetical protein
MPMRSPGHGRRHYYTPPRVCPMLVDHDVSETKCYLVWTNVLRFCSRQGIAHVKSLRPANNPMPHIDSDASPFGIKDGTSFTNSWRTLEGSVSPLVRSGHPNRHSTGSCGSVRFVFYDSYISFLVNLQFCNSPLFVDRGLLAAVLLPDMDAETDVTFYLATP